MKAFDAIEELKTRGLYQINFRNAGVGMVFYEGPVEFAWGYPFKKHLQVYDYYDSLEEAIKGELERLRDG